MRDTLLALARLRGVPEVERRIGGTKPHPHSAPPDRRQPAHRGVALRRLSRVWMAMCVPIWKDCWTVTPLYKARFEELPVPRSTTFGQSWPAFGTR